MSTAVPTLNIKELDSDTDRFVEALGNTYMQFGFCGITGHGISPSLISESYRQVQAFFALPLTDKQKYHIPGVGGARGYTALGVETARDSKHPDLKEFWHVGLDIDGKAPHESLYPNVWPTEIPGFEPALKQLYAELKGLGERVLQALALFLQLDRDYFADKVNYGNSILRPIHYPPVPGDTGGSIRAGQHEDINLITLLIGASDAGLEILRPDGSWLPITTQGDTIVVNIGDMLQRLSNHVLPSTTHRVVNPVGDGATRSRYSLPFFTHPNPDFEIRTLSSCINAERPDLYPLPITANDYLLERLAEIGLLK